MTIGRLRCRRCDLQRAVNTISNWNNRMSDLLRVIYERSGHGAMATLAGGTSEQETVFAFIMTISVVTAYRWIEL